MADPFGLEMGTFEPTLKVAYAENLTFNGTITDVLQERAI